MGSHLSSEHLAQLTPLLGSLARLVAGGSQLSEREIRTLLLGVDLAADPEALSELRLWGTLLHDLQQAPDATQRHATVEALLLRGLPEAPVLLAVATVADSGTTPTPPPTVGTTVSPHPPTAPTRLHASVTQLDFGTLQPGQTTTLEFAVQGGPGHVHVESDHVQVAPMQFGVGTTQLRVGIKPLASGLLFTSVKLVTARETLELPIMAQWQDGGVPAQLDWQNPSNERTVSPLCRRGWLHQPGLLDRQWLGVAATSKPNPAKGLERGGVGWGQTPRCRCYVV